MFRLVSIGAAVGIGSGGFGHRFDCDCEVAETGECRPLDLRDSDRRSPDVIGVRRDGAEVGGAFGIGVFERSVGQCEIFPPSLTC